MGYRSLVSSKIIGLATIFSLLLGSAHAIGVSVDLGGKKHHRQYNSNRVQYYNTTPYVQPYQTRAYYNQYYSYPQGYYYQQQQPSYYYYDQNSGYYYPYNPGYYYYYSY